MFELPSVSLDDQSAGQWETGTVGPSYPGDGGGAAHISLAAFILLLILMKAFTESNLITTDLAEIKISLLNIAAVTFMAIPGIVLFKVVTAKMADRGLTLPGQTELAAAI